MGPVSEIRPVKALPLLVLLAGCASEPYEYETAHQDCVAMTLRVGMTCEVRMFYAPRERAH